MPGPGVVFGVLLRDVSCSASVTSNWGAHQSVCAPRADARGGTKSLNDAPTGAPVSQVATGLPRAGAAAAAGALKFRPRS